MMTMILRMLILALALAAVWPALAATADEQWTLWMDTGKAMQTAQRWDEAVTAFKQAVKVSDGFPVKDKRVLDSYLALNVCYRQAKKPELAEGVEALLLARLEKEYGVKNPRVGAFLVAAAKKMRNDFTRGPLLYLWALAARDKELGPENPALVSLLLETAEIIEGKSSREDARPYLLRAVAIMEAAGHGDDPEIVDALFLLAWNGMRTDGRETEALFRRILDIQEASCWPDAPRAQRTRDGQVGLYETAQRHFAEEILLLREKIAWYERTGARVRRDAFYSIARSQLADCYQRLGYYDEARSEQTWLLEFHMPLAHADGLALQSMDSLGDLAMAQGRYAEAEAHFRQAMTLAKQKRATHPDTESSEEVEPFIGVAEALWAQGKRADAVKVMTPMKDVLALFDDFADRYTFLTGEPLNARRSVSRVNQLKQEARQTEQQTPPDHYHIAMAYRRLGRYLIALKQPAQAEAPLQRSVEAWEALLTPHHRALVHPLAELAACKAALGKTEEAKGLYRRAVGIAEGAYGAEDSLTVMIRGRYEKGSSL